MLLTPTFLHFKKHSIKRLPLILLCLSFFITSKSQAQSSTICDLIRVRSEIATITISNPSEFYNNILDVYDSNWNLIYNCNACPQDVRITGLEAGDYIVKYQSYSLDWEYVCQRDYNVTVASGTTNADLSPVNLRDYALTMPQGSVQTFTFDLKNVGNAPATDTYNIEAYLTTGSVFNQESLGTIVTGNIAVGTIPDVTGALTVPFDFSPGLYYLTVIVKASDFNDLDLTNNLVRSTQRIEVTETGGGGGTGVQCGEIDITYGNGIISMAGQSGKNYNYKIHDLNNGWAEVFSCTYNCGSQQTASNLQNGRYLVKIFNANWSLACEKEITLSNGGGGCENGDVDGDGICNDVDNCRNTFNPDQADSDGNGIGDACQNSQPLSQLFCPENIVVETNDPDGAIVTWEDPTIIPGETCQPAPVYGLRQEEGLPKGSKFPLGQTTIRYSIYDIGSNLAVCATFIVCEFSVLVKPSGGGGGGNTIQCGEISLTTTSNSIEMKGQSGKNYFFKVHDLNNSWAEAFNCSYQCGSSQTASNLAGGNYLVRIYNDSWNLICEQEINLGASSRGATTSLESFTLFPNPAQEEIAIDLKKFAGEKAFVSINNIYGQVVFEQNIESLTSEALKINLTDYVNGMYLVNIKLKNQILKSEKFLVKRLY